MRWITLAIFGTLVFGMAWGAQRAGWDVVAVVLVLIVIILFVATLAEFNAHYSEIGSIIFERKQRAVNTTPVVMIADALRGLHPENTRLLDKFIAQTVWDVTVDLQNGERDWMLRGYDVHFGFIEYVLDRSRDGRLYPRNKFVEGSKKWDPNGLVDDREQHRQFEQWLVSRLIVVREFGDNHPAMFLPPWTPDRLKVVMGFEGPQDVYKVEDETTAYKNLGAEKVPPKKAESKQPVMSTGGSLLADEDLEKIKEIQRLHDEKYKLQTAVQS